MRTDRLKNLLHAFVSLLMIGTIIAIQWLQLEYSASMPSQWQFMKSEMFILMNYSLLWIINLLFAILLRSWRVSLVITGIISTGWGIANHYVSLFNGSPLSVRKLSNFQTALSVISSYKFEFTSTTSILIFLFIAQLIILHFYRKWDKTHPSSFLSFPFKITLLIGCISFSYLTSYSPFAIKPQRVIGLGWTYAIPSYGYVNCLLDDALSSLNAYTKPSDYNISDLQSLSTPPHESSGTSTKPDIILILNESFYDLNIFAQVDPDQDYFSPFYQINNAQHGYLINPMTGGGTNNSEYELLTSNSMYLLNGDSPFNFIDLTHGGNVVHYLESLGYQTFGMHCSVPTNYARNTAYPALGFDHIKLGIKNYAHYEKVGNRNWTDSGNYLDLIDCYESASGDPRFIYMLTYQNHGGYEQNDSAFDTVHTRNDFGSLTDDINEFMSSVSLSVDAFIELTDYFENADRPVIICMVGDHAPYFIKELSQYADWTEFQENIVNRMVPYIIWSNYSTKEADSPITYASMVDLVPMVIQYAGLPLSPYYSLLLQLHSILPVRTSDGIYLDNSGNNYSYQSAIEYTDLLHTYYSIEYNGLEAGKYYLQSLFLPN